MSEDKELRRIRMKRLKKLMKRIREPKKMEAGVIRLGFSNFSETIRSANVPILVDLWAEWCMPCRMMAPVIEELARDYAGKAMFAKVNVDENPDIARRYNIMAIPTFMVFKHGRLAERIVGAVGREPLEEALRKYL